MKANQTCTDRLKRHSEWIRFGSLLAALATMTGCYLLSPPHTETRFLILTPSVSSQSSFSDKPDLVIGLGPIQMPDYLKRTEMVTWMESNRLQISDTNRWAEPLDVNFRQVLARDLERLLPADQIIFFPWYASTHVDYQVEINVDHFETDSSGLARLSAQWTIKSQAKRRLLSKYSYFTTQASDDRPSSRAAALSEVLGKLSEDIARAIAELSTTAQPHPHDSNT